MATKLDKQLKREIDVNGEPYMLTISPEGLKIVPKGKRKGQEILWSAIVNGDAALATALNASLRYSPEDAEGNAASHANVGARQKHQG